MDDLFGAILDIGIEIAGTNMGCGAKLLTFLLVVALFGFLAWYAHR